MHSKAKAFPVSSEIQAKEKLLHYIYEFLVHTGAKNTAHALINEVRWDKSSFQLGESPGFLLSWWNVFWDLYCAATPEKRDQFEPTNEAKVFQELTSNMINQAPPLQNQPQPPPPQEQFQSNQMFSQQNQPGNAPMGAPNQPYQQRFHQNRRMQPNMDFNGQNNPQMGADQRVTPGMSPVSRLTPPSQRGVITPQQQQPVVPQPQQQGGPPGSHVVGGFNPPTPANPMRPQSTMNPNAVVMPNAPMSPMSIQQQQQQRWVGNNQQPLHPPPPPHPMNYSSPSPVPYGQMPMSHHGPGTPISPQDGNPDMQNFARNVPAGMPFHDQNMPHMMQMNSDPIQHHPHMNNDMIDGMKNSPMSNIQVNRHPDDQSGVVNQPMGDISFNNFGDNFLS